MIATIARWLTRLGITGALIAIGGQTRQAQSALPLETFGLYRAGTFYLSRAMPPKTSDLTVDFRDHPGWPIAGDWTGLGSDSVGTYDLKSGIFTLCKTPDSIACASPTNLIQFGYGAPNNIPVVGRWSTAATHDGIGTFDTANGLFFLRNTLDTGNPDYTLIYGLAGDQAIVGAWNGGAIDTPGVYRSSTATFMLSDQITNGLITTDRTVSVGSAQQPYIALAGRWNPAINHSGVGLYTSESGGFALNETLVSSDPAVTFVFGNPNDIPVVGVWPLAPP